LGYAYMGVGVVLILWGASQVRRSLKPFRLRPFLLITLGIVMIYSGTQQDF
jgi:sulfite exporter TauE/SafE